MRECINGMNSKFEQLVKVIRCKASSPPNTDSSIVFAWLICGPHLVHSSRHRHCTSSVPCWVTLNIPTVGHVRAWPRSASFRPQTCPFTCGELDPDLTHGSLHPPKSTTKTTSRLVKTVFPSSRQTVPIIYNGPTLFPTKKLPVRMGDLNPQLIRGS